MKEILDAIRDARVPPETSGFDDYPLYYCHATDDERAACTDCQITERIVRRRQRDNRVAVALERIAAALEAIAKR